MISILNKIIDRFGYQLTLKNSRNFRLISDIHSDTEFMEIYNKCREYTMTSIERMYALYIATRYVLKKGVRGDFVECGVWKGGSAMLIALTLLKMGVKDRKIYLYDTFRGMPEPQKIDIDYTKTQAMKRWKESQKEDFNEWCYAPLDEVQHNLYSTQYPSMNLEFIEGMVEETVPGIMPSEISMLRLDTDWYESVSHCMNFLFPLLSQHGIIIIDDYGHWQGAKEATDLYIQESGIKILLNRIDYTGRIGIKL